LCTNNWWVFLTVVLLWPLEKEKEPFHPKEKNCKVRFNQCWAVLHFFCSSWSFRNSKMVPVLVPCNLKSRSDLVLVQFLEVISRFWFQFKFQNQAHVWF
jgi:hypothetical protein